MKIAVVAVTRQGAAAAGKIAGALRELPGAEVEVLVPAKFSGILPGAVPYSLPLADLAGALFREYHGLVMVMALGIVFRLLAPHLRDKRRDPAVVVLDEGGRFAVSALSGHLGGANDLARFIQDKTGARAVITTATDVHDLPAVDLLARDYGLAMEPFELVKEVNAALVNGDPVSFFSDLTLPGELPAKINWLPLSGISCETRPGERRVILTDRIMPDLPPGTLFLRPRNLVAGLGCRAGVTAEVVQAALAEALRLAGKSQASLRLLATVDLRSREDGLIGTAEKLGLPLVSFTRDEIKQVFNQRGKDLTFSQYVCDRIGVGGVCEPVALLAAPAARLILQKLKWRGVTVALAEESWPLWEPGRVNWRSSAAAPWQL